MHKLSWLVLLVGLIDWVPARATALEDPWAGRWAMELRIGSVARVPVVGQQRSITTSRMLVDIASGPRGWTQRHQVCDVRVESDAPGMRMVVPEAFVRSLPAREYPISFRDAAGGSRYTADVGLETIGLDPSRLGTDLPSDPQHPAVRDSDGDGAPGATIQMKLRLLGTVRLYIVQRSHLVLHGRRDADDSVRGRVEIRMQEQQTVGARPAFFARSATILPDSGRSEFTLVRVPQATDCASLQRFPPGAFSQH